jgi:TRAP-type mannitol/chloroaromatic compound transport system permease small subunit
MKQREFLDRAAARIDRANELIGRFTLWLAFAMAGLTFLVASLRYGLNLGWVFLQEGAVYIHAVFFMLAMGYALLRDAHVRVDVFYHEFDAARRAKVNLIGHLTLLIPVCIALVYFSAPYVWKSWTRLEGSQESGGIPALFVLKSLLLVMPLLLVLQALSSAWTNFRLLEASRRAPAPRPDQQEQSR